MNDWKDANVSTVICHCRNVTKKEIIMAINNGARNLDDIRRMTNACTGTNCKYANPAGKPCGGDVLEMIFYYTPLAEALQDKK